MPDEEVVAQESGQESTPISELPIPKIEGNSGDERTSSADTESIVKSILSQLDPILDKKVQSIKDRRFSDLEKKIEGMTQMEQLESLGVDIPEDVKLKMRLSELENAVQGNGSPTKKSQGSGSSLTADSVSKTITELGLDANEPDVIEALGKTYRSTDHFEAEMGKLAIRKVLKPKPDASSSLTKTTPTVPGSPDAVALEARLIELAKNPSAPGAMKEMTDIRNKLKGAPQ